VVGVCFRRKLTFVACVRIMSGKTEQEKQKAVQEKHQAILCELLRLDDNKYCVDCDAKGECLVFIEKPALCVSEHRRAEQRTVNLE